MCLCRHSQRVAEKTPGAVVNLAKRFIREAPLEVLHSFSLEKGSVNSAPLQLLINLVMSFLLRVNDVSPRYRIQSGAGCVHRYIRELSPLQVRHRDRAREKIESPIGSWASPDVVVGDFILCGGVDQDWTREAGTQRCYPSLIAKRRRFLSVLQREIGNTQAEERYQRDNDRELTEPPGPITQNTLVPIVVGFGSLRLAIISIYLASKSEEYAN